jgi:site-specific DNA recombinase
MFRRGLRNRNGGKVSLNGLSTILRNPFYVGLIRILKTSQTFKGNHEPLISVALFERVQAVLSGKRVDRVQSHLYTYSRIARCATCKYSLIAEGHKGHVYYRCHNRPFKTPAICPPTSIREEAIDNAVLGVLAPVQFSEAEIQAAREYLTERRKESEEERAFLQTTLKLQHEQVSDRISKLTDLLVEGTITKPLFQSKHRAMLFGANGDRAKNGGSEARRHSPPEAT